MQRVALSAEKDFNRLLETILIEAQRLSNANGGMVYLLTPKKTLQAMIGRNETLGIAQGGTSGVAIDFIERLLLDDDGKPNHRDVIAHAAITNQRLNIIDTYETDKFDFDGMHSFDAEWGYRTQSLITIPLNNERDEVIGVLQLINATDPESGQVIPFAVDDVVETLILLASAALSSYLREEQLRSEINRLQIQIDPQRMAQQVTEITETDFFQELQAKAKQMRRQKRK
ncbi:MAG: GAF domain-containing protein [Caldilineaceae bacterium]